MEKLAEILDSLPYLLKMPSKKIWIDYDDEADVLYISFRKPQQADDSIMEDDLICHYRGKELVGITVLHAKKRAA
ncbi:MAG: DUF2283 domain-containing protein [Thermodesulfobacteriota bacterium]|nr:DUF2283 domain-containing protein [Thermodesulfobacteriota bacterium]